MTGSLEQSDRARRSHQTERCLLGKPHALALRRCLGAGFQSGYFVGLGQSS